MIDETDTFLPSNEELRGILNSGYNRKMAFVVRVAYGPAEGKTEAGAGQPQNGKPHYYPAGLPEQRHCPQQKHHRPGHLLLLVSQGHRPDWPLARHPGRSLRHDSHATQTPRR